MYRLGGCLRPCLDPQLAVDVAQVRLDGALAQSQAIRDRLIAFALDDRLQNLGLPLGQRLRRPAPRAREGLAPTAGDPPRPGVVLLGAARAGVLEAPGP